jgi:protoheme IX farnesyltransferase
MTERKPMNPYVELTKPRIALMVAVTALIGYRIAGGRDWVATAWMLAGVTLSSCCTGTLNQCLERDRDALMRRTKSRPLPSGRLTVGRAAAFGVACGVIGLALLAWKTNALACGLTAFTIFCYLALYTPLKVRTPSSTWFGAVAGAMPPLVGWAAATGGLEPKAWALFSIQFLWQIPHFLAMFWIYREDYARAGFRVMPVVDPAGATTAAQIAIHSFGLLLASVMPVLCGMAGNAYGFAALALSSAFLLLGMRASWTLEVADTRRLFFASLAYLPVVFGMLVWASA